MLTKRDIDVLDKLLDKKLNPFKKEFKDLKDKVEDLEIKLEEKTSDLNVAIFQVRAELQSEAKHIKRRLNQLYGSQETIIKFFNEDFQKLRKRLEKIEEVLNISPS